MRVNGRQWGRVAAATVGATALTFGGAVLPAASGESPEVIHIIDPSASKYELAAESTGDTAEELRAMEEDGLISVSDQGFFYYIDEAHESRGLSRLALSRAPEGAAIPGDPIGGSRPDAPVTIYLDFDGEILQNTRWNISAGVSSLAFAPAASVPDRHTVWASVAEDYAPFNVNVTTTRPSDERLYKTAIDDNEYGSHVIITDSYDEVLPAAAGNGGLAWVGATGSDFLGGALVFASTAGGHAKSVAELASHESGHNFGLGHDGIVGAGGYEEYFIPWDGVWAPAMGAGFYVPVSQWSAGGYAGATNLEDDLSIITDRTAATAAFTRARLSNGQPYTGTSFCSEPDVDPFFPRPGDLIYAVEDDECGELLTLEFSYLDRADFAADEVGDTAQTAQVLDNADGTFRASTVIERTSDVDVFALSTIGGEVIVEVDVADIAPNLDARLTVTDSSGEVIAHDDPPASRESEEAASGLGASVTLNVPAGTYYLSVEGVGFGDPRSATPYDAHGYVDYGSLGNFTLSGVAAPFVTDAVVIRSPAGGTVVTHGAAIDVTGTATPTATVTLTVDGTVVDTVTADASGNWSAAIDVARYGTTEIVVSQSIDSILIPGSESVTVTAPIAEPVITAPTSGARTDAGALAIVGTGVAGAGVHVTVSGDDGQAYSGHAFVAADGTWSLEVPAGLRNGYYSVLAVQSLDGATSESSAAVAFTVAAPAAAGDAVAGASLGMTGSDFDAAPFAAAAAMLLLLGAGLAIRARRAQAAGQK